MEFIDQLIAYPINCASLRRYQGNATITRHEKRRDEEQIMTKHTPHMKLQTHKEDLQLKNGLGTFSWKTSGEGWSFFVPQHQHLHSLIRIFAGRILDTQGSRVFFIRLGGNYFGK